MRFKFRTAAALALLCGLSGVVAAGFSPSKEPVAPDGTKAVCDLPASQHMRNTGGSDGPRGPGSGSGLCVFTSVEHSAKWQNVGGLYGFQTWMTRRPGGGYPQKLDAMLKAYCREKGIPIPPYIQHTGGDAEFLELALKTDRLPCVTYAGRDDFYGGRIAHMVNLAHLDQTRAAIIDNNRPGVWLWMTRAEFLHRWRDMQGGWAVVLLADPPPPHVEAPKLNPFGAPRPCDAHGCGKCAAACVCGDDCKCKAGECPAKCPVVFGQRCGPSGWGVPSGPVGPSVRPFAPAPFVRPVPPAPLYVPAPTVPAAPAARPEPVGNPPTDNHEWGICCNGQWGWKLKDAKPVGDEAPADVPTGVVPEKIHDAPRYSLNGVECDKAHALAAMGANPLADDSDRWHLAAVGDEAFTARVRADVEKLPKETRGKLLFQAYAPSHWAVDLFDLPRGVTLRKPSPGRTSADVGALIADADYSAAALDNLLALEGGPNYKPKPPAPKVDPAPVRPEPHKQPDDAPPAPAKPNHAPWCVAIASVLAFVIRELVLLLRKGK